MMVGSVGRGGGGEMALETETYLPHANDALITPWLSGLREIGMQCELHPEFSFSTQNGFLPIKLRLLKPTRPEFDKHDFLSGFEFYSEDFLLKDSFEYAVKKGTFRGLFRGFTSSRTYVSSTVDPILSKCRKRLKFYWGSADVFELRLSALSSLLLSRLADGISHYPADGIWYESSTSLTDELKQIEEYEAQIDKEDLKFHRFDGWPQIRDDD
jgi:hypothetical protein